MMKLFKNKKAVILSTAALAVALLAGGSYAWFTSTAAVSASNVPVAKLAVEADYDEIFYSENDYGKTYFKVNDDGSLEICNDEDEMQDPDSWVAHAGLEPGVGILYLDGKVINTGSLQAAIRITPTADVLVRYTDNDFTPVDTTAYPNGLAPYSDLSSDPCPILTDVDFSDLWDGASEELAVLFKDSDDNYYMLLDPGTYITMSANFNFGDEEGDDGIAKTIGNQFQECLVSAGSANFKATQSLPGAIRDELGVEFADLDYVETLQGYARASASMTDARKAYILEHFGLN